MLTAILLSDVKFIELDAPKWAFFGIGRILLPAGMVGIVDDFDPVNNEISGFFNIPETTYLHVSLKGIEDDSTQ